MGADARLLRITGLVQGVGYRAWFETEARRLGLTGWVRNRLDGSVEALVYGSPEAMAEIERRAATGPRAARVAAVQARAAPAGDADATHFHCLPTI